MQPPSDVELNRTTDWPNTLSVVRDFWTARRGARSMPSRKDISPSKLKAQLPELLLADVVDGGADFRYRLLGTGLTQFFASDPTGKLMSEALAPFGRDTVKRTIATYRGLLHTRAPIRITGSGAIYGQEPKLFDAWLAPLSNDGVTVDTILGTFIFVWDSEHQFRTPALQLAAGAIKPR